ncbi:hypothetical protein ABZ547_00380 [Streptomyces sparsogenes]|uniref:hypothetical protein n=1 Tax=Streptomyces sparsogenes TaxID=67365 RepID=UPI0033E4A6BA
MAHTRLEAELLAQDQLPGIGVSIGHYDGRLVRDRANWLVAGAGDDLLVGRVDQDPARVFSARLRWPHPRPGSSHGFASPLPDGGLAVSGRDAITVYEADGRVRWAYEHDPWPDQGIGSGACTADASGRRLLATTLAPVLIGGSYPGDRCVALRLADGRPLDQITLPSASAGYLFQQSLTDPGQLFLDAAMGDTFCSLGVSWRDGGLRAEPLGMAEEPFAGLSLGGAYLKLDVGGEWLSRYEAGRPDVIVEAETVLPDGLRFVGHRPGFLDGDRVLVAVAEEQWSEEARHLVLDGHTLRPVAEVRYPGTSCLDPLALGDGTWLTVHGDTVRRWRTA